MVTYISNVRKGNGLDTSTETQGNKLDINTIQHRCGKEEWCANTGKACENYPCCEATQCITFQM